MNYSDEIKEIKKLLNGNGQPGLIKTVAILETNYTTMNEAIQQFGTSLSALANAQIEHDATEKAKIDFQKSREQSKNFRLKIWAFIVTAINVGIVLIGTYLKYYHANI